MSKTTRSILMTIVLIAAAVWAISVYKTCQANKIADKENTDTTTKLKEYPGDGEDDPSTVNSDAEFDDLEGDGEGDGDGDGDGEMEESTSDTEETIADTNEREDGEEEDGRGSLDEYDGVAGGGNGEFLVVAGAFTSGRNARSTRDLLNRKGYNSEVRVFLGSDFHSVILGNYTSRTEAQKVANEIKKEKNMKDAYVHKKRYRKNRR